MLIQMIITYRHVTPQACVWPSKRCGWLSSNCCRTFDSTGRKRSRNYVRSMLCCWSPIDQRAFSSRREISGLLFQCLCNDKCNPCTVYPSWHWQQDAGGEPETVGFAAGAATWQTGRCLWFWPIRSIRPMWKHDVIRKTYAMKLEKTQKIAPSGT